MDISNYLSPLGSKEYLESDNFELIKQNMKEKKGKLFLASRKSPGFGSIKDSVALSEIKIKDKDLEFSSNNGEKSLKNKNQFVAFSGEKEKPSKILIKNNNLHIEISINSDETVGKLD